MGTSYYFDMHAEEGEHYIKALPYVIGWFERAANEAVAGELGELCYD